MKRKISSGIIGLSLLFILNTASQVNSAERPELKSFLRIFEKIRQEQNIDENVKIDADKVSEELLEKLGDSLMVYMYPATREKQFMVDMMGGKDSERLLNMHKLIGYNYLKDDSRKMLGYTIPMLKMTLRNKRYVPYEKKEFKFVQPFLVHSGMPEETGNAELRFSIYRISSETNIYSETTIYEDVAVHLEAGIHDRLGVVLRSNGLKNEDYFEFILQYAVKYFDLLRNSGISVFTQLDFPTKELEDDTVKGVGGVSTRLIKSNFFEWNANIHYFFEDKDLEYENSLIFKVGKTLYPIIELRGNLLKNEDNFILGGMKFRLVEKTVFGVGIERSFGGTTKSHPIDNKIFLSFDTLYR